ncbi:MAG: hypothetical protein V1790_10145 [Planctomycetota bacterium]
MALDAVGARAESVRSFADPMDNLGMMSRPHRLAGEGVAQPERAALVENAAAWSKVWRRSSRKTMIADAGRVCGASTSRRLQEGICA